MAIDGEDCEADVVGLDDVTHGRDATEVVENAAADGVVVVVVDVDAEKVVELLDADTAVEQGLVVADADDGVLDAVVLVLDFADDFFEQVLDGDEAGGAAVLVDDDGHVDALLAHVGEEVVHALRFGHEEGGAGDVA